MADWRARAMVLVAVVAGSAIACGSRTGDYLVPAPGDGPGAGGLSGVGAGGGTGAMAETGPAQASAVGTITNGAGPGSVVGSSFSSAFGPANSLGNTSGSSIGGLTFGSVVTGSISSTSAAGGAGGAVQSGNVSAISVGGAPATTSGEGGAGGVAECIAQSQSRCERCLCADCFKSYGDCIGDFGCPLILECMDVTGCTGLDCYAPDTCQVVIDRFGGLAGASVSYVTDLIVCAAAASCACQ